MAKTALCIASYADALSKTDELPSHTEPDKKLTNGRKESG